MDDRSRLRLIMTENMFLGMRQNDFGFDQDRNFIRVGLFKYCYFSVKNITTCTFT